MAISYNATRGQNQSSKVALGGSASGDSIPQGFVGSRANSGARQDNHSESRRLAGISVSVSDDQLEVREKISNLVGPQLSVLEIKHYVLQIWFVNDCWRVSALRNVNSLAASIALKNLLIER
jgi:hypothetical protein